MYGALCQRDELTRVAQQLVGRIGGDVPRVSRLRGRPAGRVRGEERGPLRQLRCRRGEQSPHALRPCPSPVRPPSRGEDGRGSTQRREVGGDEPVSRIGLPARLGNPMQGLVQQRHRGGWSGRPHLERQRGLPAGACLTRRASRRARPSRSRPSGDVARPRPRGRIAVAPRPSGTVRCRRTVARRECERHGPPPSLSRYGALPAAPARRCFPHPHAGNPGPESAPPVVERMFEHLQSSLRPRRAQAWVLGLLERSASHREVIP